jgi:hypothetical protein
MPQRIDAMLAALQRISRCSDLDQCARGIAAKKCRQITPREDVAAPAVRPEVTPPG